MKIIGLTGGIGSGKSTVSKYLMKKECYIIDADEISRKLTGKGGDSLPQLRETFGDKIFRANGELDRSILRNIVFENQEKRGLLENIITSKVIDTIYDQMNQLRNENYKGVVIIDAPLLFEFGLDKMTDETWVVRADEKTRILRVVSRDGVRADTVEKIIKTQTSDDEKTRRADVVLDNSTTLAELYAQIDRLMERVSHEDI